MTRRTLLLVVGILGVALTLLVVGGHRVLERDREALLAGFAHNKEQGIVEAARGLAADVADVGEDLELASTLLRSANNTEAAEQALHAIATIKREYLVIYARSEGQTTRVTSIDAPPGVAAVADATLERMLHEADGRPDVLHTSAELGEAGTIARWYRVYSRRSSKHGPVVAVAADTAVLLSRMKLQRDPLTRVLVLDGAGVPAAMSDPKLAKLSPTFAGMRAEVAADAHATITLDSDVALQLGLPETDAVAVGVPLKIDRGPPWTLMVVTSTQALHQQERTIVGRVVAGSALVLLLLLSAAAYVLHNAFRARTLRERVKHAERLASLTNRLLHTEKLVTAGQLAAGIAHEIGTPLNVARGRVELSLSHLGASHPEADNQRVVIDQIDRVTRLIQQLLDYVRPTSAAVQDVALAQALRTVSALLGPQAMKRHVKLHLEIGPEPQLHADPDQLQQLIINLTLNSIDACSRGGNVWLRTKSRPNAVLLEIADDGQGIPPELQSQIFDPFFTTKKRGQGTGLGLWVVAQLVRAQSGEIELESSVGSGTTIRIAWPVTA